MSHKPITLNNYSLVLPHKTCFDGLNATIYPHQKIAIIGHNGSGKSSLLKMIMYNLPADITSAYVPQIIEDYPEYSGGQRFQKALTQALVSNPDILLLDEPTNHLDLKNRRALMRLLNNFHGTLLIITHDLELLRQSVNCLWHIDQGRVALFSGNYDDYIHEVNARRRKLEQELTILKRQKQESHVNLMQEQQRAKKSKEKGAKSITKRKWPTIVSHAKATRAEETSGHKKREISHKKQEIIDALSEMRMEVVIKPNFSLKTSDIYNKTILAVSNGSVGYKEKIVLSNIHFSLTGGEHIAIMGDNGSGKSTLIKAILGDKSITKIGTWYAPASQDVGYLDQHYSTLDERKTVLQTIKEVVPYWSAYEIRKHLNDFLFRKNEEVNAIVSSLSGGEKCCLSLAAIAAQSPKLLILDEITNNLDLETREHIIQVLVNYPGSMIVVSHDENFLRLINISNYFQLHAGFGMAKTEKHTR